jgi:hypothetical protein
LLPLSPYSGPRIARVEKLWTKIALLLLRRLTSMKPTKSQLKFLRAWLLFHHSGFTFGNWFRLNWKALLIVALLLVFSALIALAIPLVGGILFGLYLGTLLRDITYFRIARSRWPAVLDVVNWDRVQQLVDTHDEPANTK